MKIIDVFADIGRFVALRRDIHAHPELGFEEHRTLRLVATLLGGPYVLLKDQLDSASPFCTPARAPTAVAQRDRLGRPASSIHARR